MTCACWEVKFLIDLIDEVEAPQCHVLADFFIIILAPMFIGKICKVNLQIGLVQPFTCFLSKFSAIKSSLV